MSFAHKSSLRIFFVHTCDFLLLQSLVNWNPNDELALLKVINELLEEYRKYQKNLLDQNSILQYMYTCLLDTGKYSEEDIEILVIRRGQVCLPIQCEKGKNETLATKVKSFADVLLGLGTTVTEETPWSALIRTKMAEWNMSWEKDNHVSCALSMSFLCFQLQMGPVSFLIKLPVDFTRIPEYLTKVSEKMQFNFGFRKSLKKKEKIRA